MKKCPKCGNISAVRINKSNVKTAKEEFLYKRRNLLCRECGYEFTIYEFYMSPEEKRALLRLASLGKEFMEFKVKFREAVQKENEARKKMRLENREERRMFMLKKKADNLGVDIEDLLLEELDNIIDKKGEGTDE